jgi:hypothetical protein
MKNKSDRLIVAVVAVVSCLMIIIAPLIGAGLLSQPQKNHNIYTNGRFGGTTTTEKATALVDDSLNRYINLTASLGTGEGGPSYSWVTVITKVTWIGTPKDSIKTLQNISLSVYTRLDENSSLSGTQMLTIGIHCIANQTEPTIPNDTIDCKEIIIPSLGLNMPSYSYTFNCSTYFA